MLNLHPPISVHIKSTNNYYTADDISVDGEMVTTYWWDGYKMAVHETVHMSDIEKDDRLE